MNKKVFRNLDQKGQLTLEFMMSLILIITVSTLLGILTFTLSLTEVLQYVTYAGARSYFAGDKDFQTQQDAGNAKASQLIHTLPFLTGAEASKWIVVNYKSSGAKDYTPYSESLKVNPQHNQFEGFQLSFTVPIMNIQIPFLKDVITPPEGLKDFGATLSSFLTREPSTDECQKYLADSWQALASQYSAATGKGQKPIVIVDNGC